MPSVGGRIRLLVPLEVDRYWIDKDIRCNNNPIWDDRIGYGVFQLPNGDWVEDFYYTDDYRFSGLTTTAKNLFVYAGWNTGTSDGTVSYSFKNDTGILVFPDTSSWNDDKEVGVKTCPKLRLPTGSEATITYTETTCTGYSMMLILFDSPYLNNEPYWFPQQTSYPINFLRYKERMNLRTKVDLYPPVWYEHLQRYIYLEDWNINMSIPLFEEL